MLPLPLPLPSPVSLTSGEWPPLMTWSAAPPPRMLFDDPGRWISGEANGRDGWSMTSYDADRASDGGARGELRALPSIRGSGLMARPGPGEPVRTRCWAYSGENGCCGGAMRRSGSLGDCIWGVYERGVGAEGILAGLWDLDPGNEGIAGDEEGCCRSHSHWDTM